MTRHADFTGAMAKTGEPDAAARGQLPAAMATALHVTNGDSTDLRGTGLAERILVWFDVLHEGPVPAVGYDELRRIRAGFVSRGAGVDEEQVLRRFVERDEILAANRDGRYVLWFEADLYDQLQLTEILARLGELRVPAERITLICIGEHPGIAHFGGLGELSADQLRELSGTPACATLTDAAVELAGRAWSALRAPQPDGLGAIASARSGELRFLGDAFDRLSREYPSTRDGLSLTERRILAAAADAAAADGQGNRELTAETVFLRTGAREARPYLGDTWAFVAMERMVRAQVPLLTADPPGMPVERRTRLCLTEMGARVLAGEVDHIALNGIDRWIGGVHLNGPDVPWRWNEGTEAITPS